MSDPIEKIGDRIRKIREIRGITASELSRLIGVTPTAVWHWEKTWVNNPRPENLAAIASALSVPVRYLRDGTGPSELEAVDAPTVSVAEIVEEARRRIALATGFTLDRVKLDLQLVAD